MDVDAYLERIAYRGPRDVSAGALRELQAAHLSAVPFENLSIHIPEPIVLDEDALVDKIVRRRRGGFCYEVNGAFAALLSALGFRVQRLAARVYRPDGQLGIELDHMALRVDLDEPWLVDVGFGDGFVYPLRLGYPGEQVDVGRRYTLRDDGDGTIVIEHSPGREPAPQYRYTFEPHELADYEPGCTYHQTSPDSPFTQRRICSLLRRTGRVTLAGERLIFRSHHGARVEFALPDEAAFHEHLRFQFGIEL